MSDTIYAKPGETRRFYLQNAPVGLVGTLAFRIFDSSGAEAVARTTEGIAESPKGSGSYSIEVALPKAEGKDFRAFWDWGEGSENNASDELEINATGAPEVEVGPLYATADALRKKLDTTAEILPDDEANEILESACDLIDERLGNRPVDPDSGRKVVVADEDGWRIQKLAKATLEIAKALYEDPGVESRQRVRSVSGDVATSGSYGPAYGERVESLLNQSGLRVNTARTSNSARRRRLR